MAFTGPQAGALIALRGIWNEERFVVIGASAIACHLGFEWRGTKDLDLSVGLGTDACSLDLESLGWTPDGTTHHRWRARDGSRIDVVPCDATALARGDVTWPNGATMSLVGMRLAFADAVPVGITPGISVRVASLRSLTLLKMAAYLDRPDSRVTDLGDIGHILHEYPVLDEDRWSDEIIDLDLTYEHLEPFVLGRQLASVADDAERQLLGRLWPLLNERDDRLLARMARLAPVVWREPESLRAAFAAFRHGFESGRRPEEM